jgi:NAD(P)-dependent dehydrogenase (short-subunit alcohol dehydrogenase family)
MSGKRLLGKRALISGGDSGIGAATAVAFAHEGADVAIVFRSDTESAKKVKTEIEEIGQKCVMVKADIKSEDDVKRIFDQVQKEFGKTLDVLINNASYEKRGDWEEYSLEDFNFLLLNNVTGNFLMTREALKRDLMQKGARILFTGSIQGLEGSPNDPAYSASKGALHAMTKSLAKYLTKKGILVNCVAPGPVDTPMLHVRLCLCFLTTPLTLGPRGKQENTPELLQKDGGEKYPLGVPKPESIAESFVFLASAAGDYYTGEILKPTSGMLPHPVLLT